MRRFCIRATVLLLALGLIVLVVTAGYAASIAVRVESIEAPAGKEVDVPVVVQGAPGIGAMHLELVYDAAVLEATTVEKGPLLGDNALLDFNAAEPGRLIIGLVTLDAVDGNGTLLMNRFKVRGEAGQTSPLKLENARAWEGKTRQDIMVGAEGGELTVVSPGLPVPLPWLAALVAAVVALLLLVMIVRRRRQPAMAGGTPQPLPVSASGGATRRFCGHCGTPVQPDRQFCTNCGREP